MNLIIDIGNSRAKAVVMEGDTIKGEYVAESFDATLCATILADHPTIKRAIIASTRGDEDMVKAIVEERIARAIIFKPATTPIPLGNHYHTPETLGADRLAAAVGAQAMYPHSDIMIVDFGTAITIDTVEDGAFKGGNISPGVTTLPRPSGLHRTTASLLCNGRSFELWSHNTRGHRTGGNEGHRTRN